MVQAAGGVMGWGIIIQHILGQNLPRGVSGVNVFFLIAIQPILELDPAHFELSAFWRYFWTTTTWRSSFVLLQEIQIDTYLLKYESFSIICVVVLSFVEEMEENSEPESHLRWLPAGLQKSLVTGCSIIQLQGQAL